MMTPYPKPRLDRDARREAILDVAQDVFLEEGFAAASMSTIAARLGGSKGTLYNYFKSKDELFEAFVQRRCLWQQELIFGPLESEGGLAEALTRLARAYIRNTMTDAHLRTWRLIIAEAERSPELGRIYYEAGPKRGSDRLAEQMAKWQAEGRLKAADPLVQARQFLSLCKGWVQMARLSSYLPELTDAQINEEVARAVETFLAAFGTEGSEPRA